MTIRIFRDVEEAISREVRRITFFDNRSVDHVVLKDTFDPFTGEIVQLPIEPDFYDSSADTKNIQYPHFFIKLLRTREDRFTGRVVPQYGKSQIEPVTTSPQAYEIVIFSSDGLISTPGNVLTTSILKIRKVLPGHLLRLRTGNNKGTYKIVSVTVSNTGDHEIEVSPEIVEDLPISSFDTSTRILTFVESLDLNTVKAGDIFEDASSNTWTILAVNPANRTLELDGTGSPDTSEGGKITRPGNVFQNTDLSLISYSVMDGTKPIKGLGGEQDSSSFESVVLTDPSVPLDLFYLVRIDSKERDTHIDIANRMWEEFNPPRTALPTIVRNKLSTEQLLTADVPSGGSNTIQIVDNSKYQIGHEVFIFDDYVPTKAIDGRGFQPVFTAKIIDKIGTNQLVLNITVPDTFKVDNRAKVVSNAEYRTFMFHFVDHVTKDVEGAQYWSHEFTFWVQVWVDRQGEPLVYDGVVQDIRIVGVNVEDPEILED